MAALQDELLHVKNGLAAQSALFRRAVKQQARLGAFDGLLVEISGAEFCCGRGRALEWLGHQNAAYVVETFEGQRVTVPEAGLKEYRPRKPEDGGFNLAWPANAGPLAVEAFGSMVVDALAHQGYCVIQMFHRPEESAAALSAVKRLLQWKLPKKEFEAAYLGRANATKYVTLPHDDPATAPMGVLARCDRLLTELCQAVEPFAASHLGLNVWGRMNGIARVPFAGAEEERLLRPESICDDDYENGVILGHLGFLERRKLLMMFVIESNGGGTLQLFLHGSEANKISLPLERGKLVVFRSDQMDYSYRPEGDCLVLQTWLLSEPVVPDFDDTRTVALPEQLSGERVFCTSIACRLPGNVFNYENFWTLFVAGGDCHSKIPLERFDVDEYFSEKQELGYTYARHGAFLHASVGKLFANSYFGIQDEEVRAMHPYQRLVLEVGHEVLHFGGYTKKTTCGLPCGVFMGDGSEYLAQYDFGPHGYFGQNKGVTCTRLSHTLGLKGPCVTMDTGCSSALAALTTAHALLRKPIERQLRPSAATGIDMAVVMAVGMMLFHKKFLLYCGPHLLSQRGRCFSFDGSGDGYARGEGSGGVFLKASSNDSDANQMFACIAGSAQNQDGRSASMTAPNGPSQQQAIKMSMREAGFSVNDITIAECHGTGTALGDPIEIGALQSVMRERSTPVHFTTSKSFIGHMEECAGMGGVIKCMLMVYASCATSNVHLRSLNPHLQLEGFPGQYMTEALDIGVSSSISGVSSFGFGGTNGRCDLWGRCQRGLRATTRLETGESIGQRRNFYKRIDDFGVPGPQEYDKVYIIGSWSSWRTLEEMTTVERGHYTYLVSLGEARREQFRFFVNEDKEQAIHPAGGNEGRCAPALGPDARGEGKSWLIDGIDDAAAPGAMYRIYLEWSFSWERGESLKVRWEMVTLDSGVPLQVGDGISSAHAYCIVGTWTSWRYSFMTPSRKEVGLWTATVRFGSSGWETFQIARDGDRDQTIHPPSELAEDPSLLVLGPDHHGEGKMWRVQGCPGAPMTIELRVADGAISVTVLSEAGNITWRNFEAENAARNTLPSAPPATLPVASLVA